MAIISAWTEADKNTQRNGERYIRHFFTDSTGTTHKSWLHSVPGEWGETEWATHRSAEKAELEDRLANIELEALLNG